MRKYPDVKQVFLLMVSMAAPQALQGCAQLCGDSATREGAWGLVFRCSTSSRTESDYTAPAGIRASGSKKSIL